MALQPAITSDPPLSKRQHIGLQAKVGNPLSTFNSVNIFFKLNKDIYHSIIIIHAQT